MFSGGINRPPRYVCTSLNNSIPYSESHLSIFNPKVPMFSAKLSWSSSMKWPPLPFLLFGISLDLYFVFFASTINGYEGTGHSLSLKLIQQLCESAQPSLSKEIKEDMATGPSTKKPTYTTLPNAQSLHEVKLNSPICYSTGDKIEQWLNSLLCLDASISPHTLPSILAIHQCLGE